MARIGNKAIVYSTLIGLAIGALLIIGGIILIREIFDATNHNEKTLPILANKLTEIGSTLGKGERISIKLDKESAIIGFNPKSDFKYSYPGIDEISKSIYSKAIYMKRPLQCIENEACICACSDISLEDANLFNIKWPITGESFNSKSAEIICDEIKCLSLQSTKFPEKSKMTDIFDDKIRDPENNPTRDLHYWDNSFILLRTTEIKPNFYVEIEVPNLPNMKAPLIVAGYRDFYPLEIVDVFLMNKGNGIVSICLKDDVTKCT